MIPQSNITAWQQNAPWDSDAQIEQDLLLSKIIIELYRDSLISENLALRGGTAIQKLCLKSSNRYSEDLDFVQINAGPIGPVINRIRKILDSWLGYPIWKQSKDSVKLIYKLNSEIPPITPIRIKIEINTREHFSVFGYQPWSFSISNPWYTGEADVISYPIDELMATKFRALYRRKKGRDLFDLHMAFEMFSDLDSERVISCFNHYMKHSQQSVTRAEYEENLENKLKSPLFTNDIKPLLSNNVRFDYDETRAAVVVHSNLISKLPGAAWKARELFA